VVRPLPRQNVCKVFPKKDLGVDLSVHIKHGSPALKTGPAGSLSTFNDNRGCQVTKARAEIATTSHTPPSLVVEPEDPHRHPSTL
jgi:hypothetical protein